jgi:hypothetical protein
MNPVSDRVKAFFEEFNGANNAFDPERLQRVMSDPLVAGDPNGEIVILSKPDWLAGVTERQDYLANIGFTSVTVVPVEEIPLGEHYTLVKANGVMRLEKTPGHVVNLVHNNAYILYHDDTTMRVAFSLSHDDLMKMMQDQGLSLSGNGASAE